MRARATPIGLRREDISVRSVCSVDSPRNTRNEGTAGKGDEKIEPRMHTDKASRGEAMSTKERMFLVATLDSPVSFVSGDKLTRTSFSTVRLVVPAAILFATVLAVAFLSAA